MRRLNRNRLRCLARLVVRAARLADADAALEEGAILDRDTLRDHVAGQRALAADIHTVAGIDVAAHLAEHHDLAGRDVRCYLAIAANGDAVARQIDRPFDLAVDVERFRTGNFALDHQALADG